MILCRLRPLLDYWDNYYSPWVVVRTGCMGKLNLMQRRLYRLKWFGKCRNGRFSVISAGTRSVNEPWKINTTSETENIYTYSLCFYKGEYISSSDACKSKQRKKQQLDWVHYQGNITISRSQSIFYLKSMTLSLDSHFPKNIDGDMPVDNESASGPVLLCLWQWLLDCFCHNIFPIPPNPLVLMNWHFWTDILHQHPINGHSLNQFIIFCTLSDS